MKSTTRLGETRSRLLVFNQTGMRMKITRALTLTTRFVLAATSLFPPTSKKGATKQASSTYDF